MRVHLRSSLLAPAMLASAMVAFMGATTSAAAQAREPFELSIMSYNVNDLPWPLRTKASKAMKLIGYDLARRRAEGTAPDVVFLQEAFTKRSRKLVRKAGYPYVVKGPGVRKTNPASRVIEYDLPKERIPGSPRRSYNRLVNSGLYILSKYPFVQVEKKVFGNDCSGSDCIANKGIIFARIRIPGHGAVISVATTHMDSNTRDAKRKKRLRAHRAQTKTLMTFLDRERRGAALILAGDINIKDDQRYAHFIQATGAQNAGQLCVAAPGNCTIATGTDAVTVTRQTNDFHFIVDGGDYRFTPLSMARTYADKMEGRRLSDHAAFEATYRVTPKE